MLQDQPSPSQTSPTKRRYSMPIAAGLRIFLFIYFMVYTYVIGSGLIPLPDEPARMKFYPLFCACVGMAVGLQILVNRYRLFLVAVLCFLPLAYHQLGKRIKFLEMMLEPFSVETLLRHSLIGVAVLLILPPCWKSFNRAVSDQKPVQRPLFFRKGIRF